MARHPAQTTVLRSGVLAGSPPASEKRGDDGHRDGGQRDGGALTVRLNVERQTSLPGLGSPTCPADPVLW